MFRRDTTTRIQETGKEKDDPSPSDFLLPLRRRASEMIRTGQLDEAGRLLDGIHKILESNEPRRLL